jgi:hypothetical protein
LHNKLNVGEKISALGYYGVKSKGKISGGSKFKDWKVRFYGAAMAGP